MIEVEAKITFPTKLNNDKITCHKSCMWNIDLERLKAECLRDNKELGVSDSGKPIARDECQEAANQKPDDPREVGFFGNYGIGI